MKRLYLGLICILGIGLFSGRTQAMQSGSAAFNYGADHRVNLDNTIMQWPLFQYLLVTGGMKVLLDKIVEPLILGNAAVFHNLESLLRYTIAYPTTRNQNSINILGSTVLTAAELQGFNFPAGGALGNANTNNFILKWFDGIFAASISINRVDDFFVGVLCLLQGIMKKAEQLDTLTIYDPQRKRSELSALFNRAADLYKVAYNEYRRRRGYVSYFTSVPGKPWLRVPVGRLSGGSGILLALRPETVFRAFSRSNVPYIKKRAQEEIHYHMWLLGQATRPGVLAFGAGYVAGKTGIIGKTIKKLPAGARAAARVSGFITRQGGRVLETTGEGLELVGGKERDPRTEIERAVDETAEEVSKKNAKWSIWNIFKGPRDEAEKKREAAKEETKRKIMGALGKEESEKEKEEAALTKAFGPEKEDETPVVQKPEDELAPEEQELPRNWEKTGENVREKTGKFVEGVKNVGGVIAQELGETGQKLRRLWGGLRGQENEEED